MGNLDEHFEEAIGRVERLIALVKDLSLPMENGDGDRPFAETDDAGRCGAGPRY